MDERVICKVCGHDADHHRFAEAIICTACPDRQCQDGPDGQRYRQRP